GWVRHAVTAASAEAIHAGSPQGAPATHGSRARGERMAFYVVDRIEGAVAVVVADDGRTFDVPRRDLPKGSREGTVLRIDAAAEEPPDWAEAAIDEPERVR